MGEEQERLDDSEAREADWKNWGPYVSDRAWGTVREDYSEGGNAWDFLSHDKSRSVAYRWNEDGIGGFCNRHQNICIAPAFWNGQDGILKERLFGLAGSQGNHGEDVKELYYYVDGTPTHSYMKMVYKYPVAAYPYESLVAENMQRSRNDPEFELSDALPEIINRHFHIDIEYGKFGEDDMVCCITATHISDNPDAPPAPLHILPHVWARNNWGWGYNSERASLTVEGRGVRVVERHIGEYHWQAWDQHNTQPTHLFTDNDTNYPKVFNAPAGEGTTGFFKDGFHEYLVHNNHDAVNPANTGTKCCAVFVRTLAVGESWKVWVRLRERVEGEEEGKGEAIARDGCEELLEKRRREADEFYASIHPEGMSEVHKQVQRQALAGMLWTKQYYHYSVEMWLEGDPSHPAPPESRKCGRNCHWGHLYNEDVISMPDKWEYPWYAAWDLAFHCVPLAMVDPEWAKRQLLLMLREWYMHPSGQLPAYEWNFADVNPPVHAWAVLRVYEAEKKRKGTGDVLFLKRCFHKLLINFTWWVNRKDANGRNLFEGGFLGLDNIGVFDRSNLPEGVQLEQADGTAWMGMFCLNMLSIAIEVAQTDPAYEDVATKFLEHFLAISRSIVNMGGHTDGLWDEETGFFYDVLQSNQPGQSLYEHLKVRSFVGLIPLFAVAAISEEQLANLPDFQRRLDWVVQFQPHKIVHIDPIAAPRNGHRLLSLVPESKLTRVLSRMLDEDQFLSAHGLRSLSKEHKDNPFKFHWQGQELSVCYEPAESSSPMFGGNSNWRGPIWFPVNALMTESLLELHKFYGEDLKVPFPTAGGDAVCLREVAKRLSQRLVSMFEKDAAGHRPVNGSLRWMSGSPHWSPLITFFEYFHGDTGAGLGASHQTGWTGLVAHLASRIYTD